MSKLDELIAELCPDGVPFKRIKDVYTRLKGTPITAGKMKDIASDEGEIRIFAGGKTVIDAHEEDIPKANITRVPAVLVQSRGVIDFVYYDKPFTFKNEMWAYTAENDVSVKFLYYVLKNNISFFRDAASGMGSLPQISLKITEDYRLPVPPLEVQREIVHILDYFTLLTAELTAELTARKKQYEFYRDNLLKYSNGFRKGKILDMLIQPITDGPHTTPVLVDEGIPFLSAEAVYEGGIHFEKKRGYITKEFDIECCKKYKPQEGDIFMVKSGSTTGKVGYVNTNERFNIWSPLAAMRTNEHNYSRFLFHLLQSDMVQKQVKAKASHGSQPNLSMRALEQFDVIIPPFDIQKKLADVLDNFDSICSNLKIGLPAEIESRQKQYEYYRDVLLTFVETGKTILTDRQTDRA